MLEKRKTKNTFNDDVAIIMGSNFKEKGSVNELEFLKRSQHDEKGSTPKNDDSFRFPPIDTNKRLTIQ